MVIFESQKNLMAITGNKVIRIGDNLKGMYGTMLKQSLVDALDKIIDTESISSAYINTYLENAHIGANFTNDEVIVSNPNYDYCYVFNVVDGVWYKRSDVHTDFIHAWPKTYAIDGSNRLVDYSSEEGNTLPFYIETRDMPIEATSYAKLEAVLFLGNFIHSGNTLIVALGSGRIEQDHFTLNAMMMNLNRTNDRLLLNRAVRSVKSARFIIAGKVSNVRFDRIVLDVARTWERLT